MLNWKRERDGQHYGKPCYQYSAAGGEGREYHIVWACDHGGTFGYTATRPRGDADQRQYLTKRWGVHWARTLRACKVLCEEIELDQRLLAGVSV